MRRSTPKKPKGRRFPLVCIAITKQDDQFGGDLYKVLDVPRTATAEEIKTAYRRQCQQHHPDRCPGDEDAARRFKKIEHAYYILRDPDRRRRYDDHGEQFERTADNSGLEIVSALTRVADATIRFMIDNGMDLDQNDLIDHMKKTIDQTTQGNAQALNKLTKLKKQYEKAIKRTKDKDQTMNYLKLSLIANLKEVNQQIDGIAKSTKIFIKAKEFLSKIAYEVDQWAPLGGVTGWFVNSSSASTVSGTYRRY